MPDWTRPGLPTSAPDFVVQLGVSGKYATVGQKAARQENKGKNKKNCKVVLKAGTLNVGIITGKGTEIADMTVRKKLDI